MRCSIVFLSLLSNWLPNASADELSQRLDKGFHHLRIDGPREWSSFPEKAEAAQWDLRFSSQPNAEEWTLGLRQQDVKQRWDVMLNGMSLGQLPVDENDMRIYFPISKGSLVDGENHLQVRQQTQRRNTPDDIRVGEVELIRRPLSSVLNEATLEIHIKDHDTDQPLPARITIITPTGTLQSTGGTSNEHLAVRPGTVYTSNGQAKIGLPAGQYIVYVGRGFEYSLESAEIRLKAKDKVQRTFRIRREVPTPGYVACDTHVHTLTHSGHGDATVSERMITLAAEGIELPVATDHNVQIDHRPFAQQMKVQNYFTPVVGNEVTTPVGHFNIFPATPEANTPNHRLNDWGAILDEIYRVPQVKVAILNHARDLHSGVRPFGPKHFNDVAAENLDGWPMRFNAMEVVNSSATQSDPFQLFEDWMALLNRGFQITPIGSSDSHDVARHFVGQGRTYIRTNDAAPGQIDVHEAVNNLLQGRVMVSYGLLVQMQIDGKYTSGDLATVPNEEVQIQLKVLGPHWVRADHLRIYSNGEVIREIPIRERTTTSAKLPRGVLWEGTVTIPRLNYDTHLVAIATGPGIERPYWKTAKPYQPTSPDWESRVIGCSGAIWLDGDHDGRRSAARDYAELALTAAKDDVAKLVEILGNYDIAVAAQAAHLLQSSGESLFSSKVKKALEKANHSVITGFQNYIAAWRKTQIARTE